MTNIFKEPKKVSTKNQLFNIAVDALLKAGWKVERVPGNGKSSVRRILKGGVTKLVSIRTTQDTWIAFPRTDEDKGWRTLDDVDQVVAVSVDDRHNPKFAKVHVLDGEEMRDRSIAHMRPARRLAIQLQSVAASGCRCTFPRPKTPSVISAPGPA